MTNIKPMRQLLPALALTFIALVALGGCSAADDFAMRGGTGDTPAAADPATAAPTEDSSDKLPATGGEAAPEAEGAPVAPAALSWRDLPAYEGNPYVYVNDGEPDFTESERAAAAGTEHYGDLDELGRCTGNFAVVGSETMPTEERGSIGDVKPSGWQMAKYDFVDGKHLFNRCHLLGFQLTGENANTSNLITGTRYLNIEGMLPFENAVADYVQATGNHVLMRVVPVFEGAELVARGVHMAAESVEDAGEGVSFNVFCYNVQPGVVIDYATGENMAAEDATPLPDVSGAPDAGAETAETTDNAPAASTGDESGDTKGMAEYVLNTNSKKFHKPSCSSVKQMKDANRQDVKDTRENIVNQGYDPCKRCNP